MEIEELILRLFDVGAVRFGAFTLKSGMQSLIYIDLRVLISYPDLLEQVAGAIWKKVEGCSFDLLCGVPYTALPLATCLSLQHRIPMVLRRKEQKTHGIQRALDGVYQTGQSCLVIEDLVTSGLSVLETIAPLEEAGLHVRDVAVFLDRQEGAEKKLIERGYRVHSVAKLTYLLSVLQQAGRIKQEMIHG